MSDLDRPKEVRKKALLSRLARVEGQIRAIRRMIEEGQRCESIAQQLAASRTAMNKAFCEMMACAIEDEVDKEGLLNDAVQKKLSELTRILTKYG
ncbi:metal-sensing transcriptional repressor [Nitrosococcus wardiae]|uniref:Metal-sensing transcriptional repressor n=1 Tax=Nitrosococcus wardiae TaxID=1814290 RepID=A0A4P7C3Q4_9GAMM|nr:metal-sensing transcriptional repressor [Nitrosococcus wardiae]QBQ55432.1 metal-sensing transcriptional repressor [Nitrosococcus wardiae]